MYLICSHSQVLFLFLFADWPGASGRRLTDTPVGAAAPRSCADPGSLFVVAGTIAIGGQAADAPRRVARFHGRREGLRGIAAGAVVLTHRTGTCPVDGNRAWWLCAFGDCPLQTSALPSSVRCSAGERPSVCWLSGAVMS